MAGDEQYSKKIYLMLSADGRINLDEIYQGGACDLPALDPDIELPPISLHKLAKILTKRILDYPDETDANELETVLGQFDECRDIIKTAIKKRDSKT